MFKVIEDPDQLVALGEAGLLWFYWSSTGEWLPSINTPPSWREQTADDLQRMISRKSYAILIEEDD